jgi:hypothetical protein
MGVARETCSFDNKLVVETVLLGDPYQPCLRAEICVHRNFPRVFLMPYLLLLLPVEYEAIAMSRI